MDGQSNPRNTTPSHEDRLIDRPRLEALRESEAGHPPAQARSSSPSAAIGPADRTLRTKRAFDIALTIVAAPLWVPVLAIAASAIAVTGGFPLFYVSSRRVFRSRSARIRKLRVMVKDAERIVNRDTVPIDGERFLNIPSTSPVYTRTGRWIERCSLTELPQLFNVLRGEMSVVGNRPLPENVVAALRTSFPDAERRFDSPAGLTGPVQLVGRDKLSDADRLDLEIEYCEICRRAYSPLLDLYVLVNTVLICLHLRRRLSPAEVKAAMARFARPRRPAGGDLLAGGRSGPSTRASLGSERRDR